MVFVQWAKTSGQGYRPSQQLKLPPNSPVLSFLSLDASASPRDVSLCVLPLQSQISRDEFSRLSQVVQGSLSLVPNPSSEGPASGAPVSISTRAIWRSTVSTHAMPLVVDKDDDSGSRDSSALRRILG